MNTSGRPSGPIAVRERLQDGGVNATAILDVLRGVRDPETVIPETWLKTLRETDGLALRFRGTGYKPYYLRYIDGEFPYDDYVEVCRGKSQVTEHDPEGEYVDSLFRQYNVELTITSEVSCFDGV
jgi:hypothetical protein